MYYKELVNKCLIEQINNKFICLKCNKICTKLGISNHYFYNHTEEGKKKKEQLRVIALINNNKPEMKKKISEKTKEKLNTSEIRNNLIKSIRSKEYKEKHRKTQIKLWKDPEYKKKQSKAIKSSRTKEYKQKVSEIIKKSFNKPNSIFQSEEFSKKCSKNTTELWKDENFKKKQKVSRLKSWDNKERRKNLSDKMKKIWKNSEHQEKVMKGRLNYVNETGIQPCFGKIGTTKKGTFYESTLEKEVFEFLENNNILFEPHVIIPNSYKICDLITNDIWIEIDGMSRHKVEDTSKFGWNGKLKIYENLKNEGTIKDYKIFTSSKGFIIWYNKEYQEDILNG